MTHYIDYAVELYYDPWTGEREIRSDRIYKETEEEARETAANLIKKYGENRILSLYLTTVQNMLT